MAMSVWNTSSELKMSVCLDIVEIGTLGKLSVFKIKLLCRLFLQLLQRYQGCESSDLIWFQTVLLFTNINFQTFNALKSTYMSFQVFQNISDFFRLFLTDALTPVYGACLNSWIFCYVFAHRYLSRKMTNQRGGNLIAAYRHFTILMVILIFVCELAHGVK